MQPDVKKLHDAAQALRQTEAFRHAMDKPHHPAPPLEPSDAQVMAQNSTPQTWPQTETANQESSTLGQHQPGATYSSLRLIAAWVIGFIVWIGVGILLGRCGDLLGVPSDIYLSDATTITHGGGRFSYDEEVSSLQTFFGQIVMGFSFMVALWAGRATYFQSIGAGFTDGGRLSFFAWLIAMTVLLCLSLVYHLAFAKFNGPIAYYAQGLLGILTLFGVGWASHQWYKNRVAALLARNKHKGVG